MHRGSSGVDTFTEFSQFVLDMREEDGIRSIYSDRRRFRAHLEESAIGKMRVKDINPVHIVDLARSLARKEAADKQGKRKISRRTVARAMSLVSAIFKVAVIRGIRPNNPCIGIEIPKSGDDDATKEKWAYLTQEELKAITECQGIDEPDRLMILFAVGTGLRQGEQWNLELRDLRVEGPNPLVFVRFGSRGRPPKNGKTRSVPLFGLGLEAAKRWLELLPRLVPHNPMNLVFPTLRKEPGEHGQGYQGCSGGYRRQAGKFPSTSHGLMDRLAKAGIERHIRWHDLRHTCATWLVAGWWGRRWSLQETKEMLGHSSVTITERYAHLGETALRAAANETQGGYAALALSASA